MTWARRYILFNQLSSQRSGSQKYFYAATIKT
jgi:hypothetical protein